MKAPGRGGAYQLTAEPQNPSGGVDQNSYLDLHARNKNAVSPGNGTSVRIKMYWYARQKIESQIVDVKRVIEIPPETGTLMASMADI